MPEPYMQPVSLTNIIIVNYIPGQTIITKKKQQIINKCILHVLNVMAIRIQVVTTYIRTVIILRPS